MLTVIVVVSLTMGLCQGLADERNVDINKLVISKHCSKTFALSSPVAVHLTTDTFKVLTKCLNCSLTLTTDDRSLLVATLVSLGTETGHEGECDLVRFDVFDGNSSSGALLSDKDGICGCKFPNVTEFKSSGPAMTVRLQTTCNSSLTPHGDLALVVASVNNDLYNRTECKGQFECDSGQCLDKNLVCNGHDDCRDKSDETNCTTRNGTCPGQFECKDDVCIDKNLVCNGEKNCPDGSDEEDCHGASNVTCAGKFECRNTKKCIDKNLVCNGKNDCGDNSDETGCSYKHRVLLYILIAVAVLCLVTLVVILIVVCCKYCCFTAMAKYQRM